MSFYGHAKGNLTRDPEVRFTSGDKPMAIVTGGIATGRREKRGNEWKNVPTFINYKIVGRRGETFAKFHKKGSPAYLVGELTTEYWTDKKTGEEKSKQVFEADKWEFCGAGESDDDPTAEDAPEGGPFPWEKR